LWKVRPCGVSSYSSPLKNSPACMNDVKAAQQSFCKRTAWVAPSGTSHGPGSTSPILFWLRDSAALSASSRLLSGGLWEWPHLFSEQCAGSGRASAPTERTISEYPMRVGRRCKRLGSVIFPATAPRKAVCLHPTEHRPRRQKIRELNSNNFSLRG
jgi:hypothetical protein